MNNSDFTDLSSYIETISGLANNLYIDKEDVNEIEEGQQSTHVTASDLNTIKSALSTLLENVNDINRHLISGVSTETNNSTSDETINQGLNRYLANDYLRKNQLVVNGVPANDSVVYLDETYLRWKNIFVDGYKISYNSNYNLVSWNQFNNRLNAITTTSNIDDILADIRSQIQDIEGIYINSLSGKGLDSVTNITILPGQLYYVNSYKNINLTIPLQAIIDHSQQRLLTVSGALYNRDSELQSNLNDKIDKNYRHFQTIETNEWSSGVRVIGSGYKVFSKNDIIDPAYREYKWFRVYSCNLNTALSSITIYFDPTYHQNILGHNYPTSTTITNSNKDIYANTYRNGYYSHFYRFKNYSFKQGDWDTLKYSQGPSQTPVNYQFRTDPIYQGWVRGWMECGGQQRVYAWKDGNYIRFSPSTILFPIPFESQMELDIQVTIKRDNCQPFPYIIPISVLNEDTYFCDIIGGAQGITDNPTGFMFIKWEAKGVYLINNLLQYYYLQKGYDKIHDLYWIDNATANRHYSHMVTDNDSINNVCSSDAQFKYETIHDVIDHIYQTSFQQEYGQIIRDYQASFGWFVVDYNGGPKTGKVVNSSGGDDTNLVFGYDFKDTAPYYTEIPSSHMVAEATAGRLSSVHHAIQNQNNGKWYRRKMNSLEYEQVNDQETTFGTISFDSNTNKFIIDGGVNLRQPESIEYQTFANAWRYPCFSTYFSFRHLRDYMGIMSGYLPLYYSDNYVTTYLTATLLKDTYNTTICPEDILQYISTLLELPRYKSTVWDTDKIRQYYNTSNADPGITSYVEANEKATLPQGALWTYQDNHSIVNGVKPQYYDESTYPSSVTTDDDRLRLHSTVTRNVNSWLIYHADGTYQISSQPY